MGRWRYPLLARQAIVILRELRRLTGQGEYVFPAPCMTNNTLNAALRRLGYFKQEVRCRISGRPSRPCSTKRGRWNPDAIEQQLAHMEENDVRRAYMLAGRDDAGVG